MKSEHAEKMREAIEALTFLVFPLIAGTFGGIVHSVSPRVSGMEGATGQLGTTEEQRR